MDELAINGGSPIRDAYLPYAKQYIDDGDAAAVSAVLRSDFLTCGPKVAEAESELAKIAGTKYCVLVSNGTAALHCACSAAGIKEGDEVITTPITFAASANAVLYCGGTPVFADIDPVTFMISPESIEKSITGRTKAVIAVDYTGQPCDYGAIRKLCAKHNLLLIEDAAHSLGTAYKGEAVGSIADMTTFSFHPVKMVTSGEGGAISTNSREFYERLSLISKHGITRNPEILTRGEGWYYEEIELGYNYRMTDIQCALLMSQLNKLGRFVAHRDELTKLYRNLLGDIPEVTLQREYEGSSTARHLFVIRLNTELLKAGRKEVFDALRAENIGVNVHYIPVYAFPFYRKMGYRTGICPNAEALYSELITLPLYYSMTDGDVVDVVNAVKKVVAYYKK